MKATDKLKSYQQIAIEEMAEKKYKEYLEDLRNEDAIIQVLKNEPDKAFSVNEVANITGIDKCKVSHALYFMSVMHEVRKCWLGKYKYINVK